MVRKQILARFWAAVFAFVSISAIAQESPANKNGTEKPWTAVLAQSGPLPSFEDTCFTSFDAKKSLTQVEELHQWFEVIAGQPLGILETKTRLGKCGAIEGLVRLNVPWTPDMAWRFALDDYNRLQIHLFRGESGVTLIYHEDDLQRWAGYVTTRKNRGVTPVSWHLAATDGWRNRRTSPRNHDQYELRCVGDEAILSRGDIVLLRVPFKGQPEEVLLQGKAAFHGISVVRTRDFPARAEAENPIGRTVVPAVVTWIDQSDDVARAEKLADGSMRLNVLERPKKRSWIATPLPRETTNEILLEVLDPTPGSGIYFGNGKDGARHVLRYVLDRRSRQLCLIARQDDDVDEQDFRNLIESPLPSVTNHHWIRVVFGAGQIRWWFSADRVHWSEAAEPIRNVAPDITHFGLHCVNRREPTTITLKRISIRELDALAKLAEPELRRRAVSRAGVTSLADWTTEISKQLPAGTDADAWRRACALRTIAAGCNRTLGNELLLMLANDELTLQWPTDEQLKLLHDISLLVELWDDNGLLQRLAKRYHDVGRTSLERQELPPFSAIRQALMTTPIATRHQLEIATDEMLRAEIIQRVYSQQWRQLLRFGQTLRFFQLQQKAPLLDWSMALALRNLPVTDIAGIAMERQKDDWREPLVDDLNKDVYNFLAQLRVELQVPGREDAARTIAALENTQDAGVAPHWHDKQLFVSLPIALQSATRDDALRSVLREKYRDLATLRVRQATANANRDAIELISNQFPGSDAANQAHQWLGDRALALGRFAEAEQQYRKIPAIESELGNHTRNKSALANALKRLASSTNYGIDNVSNQSPASETATDILRELEESAAKATPLTAYPAGIAQVANIPAPGNHHAYRRARFDGPTGNDPNRELVRDINRRQFDWVDRQLGIAYDHEHMFVCNRFQISAYDLETKKRIWQTASPPGQIQFAQESTLIAARPFVDRNRVFVRLLYGSAGTLACVDRSNGQYVWTVAPQLNEEFVSDPFFLAGELACFSLVRREQQENVLRLVTFDQPTGFPRTELDILSLRDSWRKRRYCEFTVVSDGVIAALGGVAAKIDSHGRLCWLRKQISLPADEEPEWARQFFQPPLVIDQRLYLFQPGVRTLDCVDSNTGELIWSRLFFDLERVIGEASGNLICQRADTLVALNPTDGKTVWSTSINGLTVAATCAVEGGMLCIHREQIGNDKRYRPRLSWIDTRTGKLQSSSELKDLEDADPRFGPLLIDKDRLWTFWGSGSDPTRDVIEISVSP